MPFERLGVLGGNPQHVFAERQCDLAIGEHEADRAARHLRGRGIDVPDTLLAHVDPLGWEHISLTDDYLWSGMDKPRERFRPLRTTGSDARP